MKIFTFGLLGSVALISAHRERRDGHPHVWGYKDQSWQNQSDHWAACGKEAQSPIDIQSNTAETHSASAFPFTHHHYEKKMIWEGKNNGHTITLYPKPNNKTETPSFSGVSLLEGNYELAQFHFHWGTNDDGGSEHTLNGKRYFSEIHLVHKNTKYANLSAALSHSDGLAVVGYFLHVGEQLEEKPMDKLVQNIIGYNLVNVTAPDHAARLQQEFSVHEILGEGIPEFYRYKGSLTTPPCSEVVQWTVVKKPIEITKSTKDIMTNFAKMKAKDDSPAEFILSNFRDVQPMNGRSLKFFSDSDEPEGEPEPEPESTDEETKEEKEEEGEAEPEPEGEGGVAATGACLLLLTFSQLVL